MVRLKTGIKGGDTMAKYDYMVALREDIKEALFGYEKDWRTMSFDEMRDNLFYDDYVTGAATGSYTMSRETAKNYVMDNLELCDEAFKYYDDISSAWEYFVNEDFERMDMTIRCYLLPFALEEVLQNDDLEVEK